MPIESTVGLKRPVNLTLNEDLVAKVKTYTPNLSGTVEGLLAEYVLRQQQASIERARLADACSSSWNALHTSVGSFADEHTAL